MRKEHELGFNSWCPSAMVVDNNVSDGEIRVMLILSSFFNINGEYFGSNAFIANKLGLSERTISRNINLMIDKGYIISKTTMSYDDKGKKKFQRHLFPETGRQNCLAPLDKNGEGNYIKNNKNKGKVENKENVSNVDEKEIYIVDNFKILRRYSKTVAGKQVSLDELKFIVSVVNEYNDIRENYFWTERQKRKPNGRTPDSKACRQLVEMHRDGTTLKEISDVAYSMFADEFLASHDWKHLTLEFLSRPAQFEKYTTA